MVKNIFQWPPLAIIYINNKKKKFKCPLYGLSPQSRSQSDSGKHKEYTMYYTKPVPYKRDTVGSFDLQQHGKEHTSWVMCLKDTQLQKPLRQSQWGPTHWMSRWMFFSQRNMTKSCTVHVLYTAKKKKKLYQPIGNIRLHNSQHVHGGLVQLNKNAIVDLKQTEQL